MAEEFEGRFEVHELLGEGSMALVHRALDRESGEWVALKRLHPRLVVSASFRARFQTEVRALATLDHPNLVRILGHGKDGSTLWMAMELVEGRTLYHWMRAHGPMQPRQAVGVTLQVCEAIAAAHEEGIIHRDIKPQNVLVDRLEHCRVVDFGIARMVEDPGRITRTGMTMGTYGYMSPEQQNDAKRIDSRTDVFSIGALLLALLVGRDPIHPLKDVTRFGENIPESLVWPLTRAALPDPEHRYESVDRLARTLAHAQDLLPALTPETPSLHLPFEEAS